jgi:phosphoglycerol transferase MdoB-like AlkP superfamily enzyme
LPQQYRAEWWFFQTHLADNILPTFFMKSALQTVLKLSAAAFYVLTSLLCLLAFIPYTYLFLIKEPPYLWLISFLRYHSFLYWAAFLAQGLAYWPQRKNLFIRAALATQAFIGIYVSARNFLPHIENRWPAYGMGIAVLASTLMAAAPYFVTGVRKSSRAQPGMLSYTNAVLSAVTVALLSCFGSLSPGHLDPQLFLHPYSGLELGICIVAAHVWIAVLAVSIFNVVLLAARKIAPAYDVRPILLTFAVIVGLSIASSRCLQDSLTFGGWLNVFYSVLFSTTITVVGFTVLQPLLVGAQHGAKDRTARIVLMLLACFAAIAVVAWPNIVGEVDWNGVFKGSVTILLWILVPLAIFRLRPRWETYSLPGMSAVLLIAGFTYWGLTVSAFLWARELGATEGRIAAATSEYANQNVSFGMTHELISGRFGERCGELCTTMRQYTNIPNAQANFDLHLVQQMSPATVKRPNIFIIVVDSLRQDHVGAYNPRVHFTPNLDSLARDSFVMKNAYTQYSGTSLSESALWAGTLLLHSHFMQPFDKVNSLKKLAQTDGYQIIVSYDEILRSILPDRGDFTKLDANKPWNELELSTTLSEAESVLDSRKDPDRPVFFYAQPKNVHLLARNKLPHATSKWDVPPEFDRRISWELHQVDEFLGDFIHYLKSRNMYDNSILIITADHGDAEGQFGRSGHVGIIVPEVARVPLIIHLPEYMRSRFICDPDSIATLTDITPTLYYLLGHTPIEKNNLFGRPLFTATKEELNDYHRTELFLASDQRAAYGLLSDNGRFLFAAYDSPLQVSLFDLHQDPNATRNILTPAKEKQYEQRVLNYLEEIDQFYNYHPTGASTR